MSRKIKRYNPLEDEKKNKQPPRKQFRAGLYARVSREKEKRPKDSLENQLAIMRSFVDEQNDLMVFHEYMDSGYTGTNFTRPAFMEMMEDVKSGRINCIVVKDLSRFGRDYLETTNYMEVILPFMGIRLISVNDRYDSLDKTSSSKELEVALKNLANDMYAKDTSKKIVSTRQNDIERGTFVGSFAPYGYRVKTFCMEDNSVIRRLVVDEEPAEIVREIFELAADGVSMRKISQILIERNVNTPYVYLKTGELYNSGSNDTVLWTANAVLRIIHNESYKGILVQGKKRSKLYENYEVFRTCIHGHDRSL